jgi:hypothetical protein
MSDYSDFEDELRGSKRKKLSKAKKRSRQHLSDSDDDVSLDDESDWEQGERGAR